MRSLCEGLASRRHGFTGARDENVIADVEMAVDRGGDGRYKAGGFKHFLGGIVKSISPSTTSTTSTNKPDLHPQHNHNV